jgi:DMSO reductase anchor subunit
MALATYVPALVLALGWVLLGTTGGLFMLCALLAAAGAVLTVWCTGMIYASLAPIRQWHHPLVAPIYLAFALMTGSLLAQALLALGGAPHFWAGVLAVLAIMLAWGLKAIWWRMVRGESLSTVGSATGLSGLGLVGLLDPPHTETNYLLQEMVFRIGRRHGRKLRRLSYGFGLAAALVLCGVALATTGLAAAIATTAAALAGLVGVAIERWLFFAQAHHTVRLYYSRAA